jgi:hypothetical protein
LASITPTNTGPAAADSGSVSGRAAHSTEASCDPGSASAHISVGPHRFTFHSLNANPPEVATYERAIAEAAERIAEWVPKGVHFGWEKSFKNKGKFPATMSKDEARHLVAGLLRSRPLTICPNEQLPASGTGRLRVVADAGRVIGTRRQRRVRIVLVRDKTGFVIENAFPVHDR